MNFTKLSKYFASRALLVKLEPVSPITTGNFWHAAAVALAPPSAQYPCFCRTPLQQQQQQHDKQKPSQPGVHMVTSTGRYCFKDGGDMWGQTLACTDPDITTCSLPTQLTCCSITYVIAC